MVIEDKILDQLINFVESNDGFMYPSVRVGEYKGYNILFVLDDPVNKVDSDTAPSF